MTTKILLMIKSDETRNRFLDILKDDDHFSLQEGPALDLSANPSQIAKEILAEQVNVVIIDYLAEDAFSVKVLQDVSDVSDQPTFIFVDTDGILDRENMMMAINEGARSFVSADMPAVALINTVVRAASGPGRLRRDSRDIDEASFQKIHEELSQAQLRLNLSHKLIAYLLATPLSSQPRKTLILSDSGYQRELLKKHLEDNNFVVSVASGIDQAIALALSEKPRIVISDLGLEDGKTGLDFCRELKIVNKFSPCHFVICTASSDKQSQVMVPGNGVDDCVLKPATNTDLNDLLARISLGLIL